MTVYVLVRHDGTSALVLGVFQRSLDARVYVQDQFGENPAAWRRPRPGRQHWSLEQHYFTFLIEEHAVNAGTQRHQHLRTMMRPQIDSGGTHTELAYFTD